MFTKEMMDTFTDLDLAVYDCIVKNRATLLPEMRGGRIQ